MALPDRFEQIRFLGKGGLARVYLARDLQQNGREVAVKLLAPRFLQMPEVRKRFGREARILQGIEHPHILQVYDFELDVPVPFLTMECIQGGDLDEYLQARGRLPLEEGLRLGIEVASALDALHEAGVVHRDLKPANIMLRAETRQAVVMDLGLAAVENATMLTKTGQLLGTPRYFPPECLLAGTWDHRSDQFQLGSILFEVLSGRKLVEADGIEDLLSKIRDGYWNTWPEDLDESQVPANVREAIHQAVSPEPDWRFPTCGAFLEATRDRGFTLTGEQAAVATPMRDAGSGGVGPGLARAAISSAGVVAGDAAPGVPKAAVAGLLVLMLLVGVFWPADVSPRQLRWSVVGDAALVRFERGGVEGLEFEVDGAAVALDARPDGEGWRLVYRGLTATDDTRLALRWPGGGSSKFTARADPPALRGPPRPAPEGEWQVDVARPVHAWWQGDAGARRKLEPEVGLLPPPSAGATEFALVWEEEGLAFGETWSRNRVLTSAGARLSSRVGGVDVRQAILDTLDQGVPLRDRLGAYLEEWRQAGGVLPDLLASDSLRAARLRLWGLWQDYHRARHVLAARGEPPAPALVPAGQLGSVSQLQTLPTGPHRVEVDLEPDHWPSDHREAGDIYLNSDPSKNAAFSLRHDDSRAVDFPWPEGLPRDKRRVLVALRARYLRRNAEILVSRSDREGGFQFRVQNPDPRPGDAHNSNFDSWTAWTVPADLLPQPGSPMRIVLRVLGPQDVMKGILKSKLVLVWPDPQK